MSLKLVFTIVVVLALVKIDAKSHSKGKIFYCTIDEINDLYTRYIPPHVAILNNSFLILRSAK